MFTTNQILSDTYQILQPIGRGGSSSVYLAYHLRLRKHVVIKQLRGQFSSDFLARTEVDILKNLHHPNLPQVYDFIQNQGSIYTVIDYVDGYDLESYVRGGIRFTEPQLKHCLCQVAQVLSYLHGQNPPVIHSDIKPGNIIMDGSGNAILIDFNTSIGANQGNLLGLTLPYASPEQLRLAQYGAWDPTEGVQLDCRSDIYSLGATFYELISGICPTPGIPPQSLHTMGLTQYSQGFLQLIDRMMAYDREDRIKSAKKILNVLERLDGSYWKLFTLRCASVLICAGLMAGGIYCCIRGSKAEKQEHFQSYYTQAVACISRGEPEAADDMCDRILEDGQVQSYLQQNPKQMAQLYHLMGDAAYYQTNYKTAATYYGKALEYGEDLDPSILCGYYRDAAIALADAGDVEAARNQLKKAEITGAQSSDLLLVQIVLDARQGNKEKCIAGAKKLFKTTNQQELLLRAALSAASVSEDLQKTDWLTKAVECGGGRLASRELADAYGQIAIQSIEKDKTKAAQKACALYEKLCQWEYAPVADFLNYATVLHISGDSREAAAVLRQGLERMPGDYRLQMNLCFLYRELGDDAKAASYCKKALQAWHSDTSADKHGKDSDEIQDLLALAEHYGVGG